MRRFFTNLKNKIDTLGKMLNKFLQSVEQEHLSKKIALEYERPSSIHHPVTSIRYLSSYACAVGPPKFKGSCISSKSLIVPFAASYLLIFSVNAFINRLACCGVKIMRDLTLLFGVPGITFTKSTTNSACEWVMIARLAYVPSATSSEISMLSWLVWG